MNNSWDNEIPVIPTPDSTAWESNKQEVPSPDQPLHAAGTSIDIPPPHLEKPDHVEEHRNPSLPRFLIRVWQCFASVGAFGFQIGATPVNIHAYIQKVFLTLVYSFLVKKYHLVNMTYCTMVMLFVGYLLCGVHSMYLFI